MQVIISDKMAPTQCHHFHAETIQSMLIDHGRATHHDVSSHLSRCPASPPCCAHLRPATRRQRPAPRHSTCSAAPSCSASEPRQRLRRLLPCILALSASHMLLCPSCLGRNHRRCMSQHECIVKDAECITLVCLQPSRIGASELASSILGPWKRAPKAGRDTYERYTAAISAALGGEASTQVCTSTRHEDECCVEHRMMAVRPDSLLSLLVLQEVQAAAAAAWPVMQSLPPAEQLRGRGSAAALEPIRHAVAVCAR